MYSLCVRAEVQMPIDVKGLATQPSESISLVWTAPSCHETAYIAYYIVEFCMGAEKACESNPSKYTERIFNLVFLQLRPK